MATIKSYTDISQSKKLAKILPLESADMYYHYNTSVVKNYHEDIPKVIQLNNHFVFFYADIPCWSLSALLGVLPTLDGRNAVLCKDIRYDEWHICYHSTAILSLIDTERYDNPVDACYELITKLYELKML